MFIFIIHLFNQVSIKSLNQDIKQGLKMANALYQHSDI